MKMSTKRFQKTEINKILRDSIPDRRLVRLTPKQLESLKTVSAIALAIIAAAGIATVAVIAPNLFSAIGKIVKFAKTNKPGTREEKIKKLERTFYYLKTSGLIRFKSDGKDYRLELTEKGKDRLKKIGLEALMPRIPKKWDGKWWLVAADIPTKEHRLGADKFRKKLHDMGFYFLQRTLWLYPYDPRKEVQFIAEAYGIEKFFTVMEINRLDEEDGLNLKHFFGL